jgi:septal ring factor EnvC (AmiA/AmiB activator)
MRTERDAKQELEKQLNEAMQNLQALISDLERKRAEQTGATATYFEQNKGKLPWPVRGRILAGFGSQVHPLYKTKTNNTGIDIATTSGVLALAIAGGKVAFADQFMGYGKLVILDHGAGYYTLYGNLEDILPGLGAEISAGTPVGHTKEYLHFEVRKQGQPVDPSGWLEP